MLAVSEAGGQFKMENLPPDPYRIQMVVPYALRERSVKRDGEEVAGYPNAQFYPGVEDATAAAVIPVEPGVVLNGFDIRLKRVPLVEFSGRVVDGPTHGPLRGGEVELAPAGGLRDSTYDRRAVGADGGFRFDLIRPGRYALLVYRSKGDKQSPFVANVEVGRSGLRDFEEMVPVPVRLSGRVIVPEAKAAEWGAVQVILARRGEGGVAQRESAVGADGAFGFEDVMPGEWGLYVSPVRGLSRAWYVKGMRANGQPVPPGRLRVAEGENAPVEIVLGEDAATLAGVVSSSPAMVVVRGEAGIVASQTASGEGAFAITGLAPGEYRVIALPPREALSPSENCLTKAVKVVLGSSERRVVGLETCVR